MVKVAVVNCDTYDEEIVFNCVSEAIEKADFELPEHKRILIKPNIVSQNRPDQYTITHFSVIDAICRLLKARHNDILIGESIAFYQKGLTVKAFECSGIKAVAEKYNAKLIAFENEALVSVVNDGVNVKGLDVIHIPKILTEVDLIIDACKLKTHSALRFSGALKNIYGCLPGGYKQRIHQWVKNEFEFSDVLIDIHKSIAPTFSIMDAIVGLDGGPTALGKPVKTGMILASENPAAIDLIAGSMIGYQIEKVPMFLQAIERGMIRGKEDIQIVGKLKNFDFSKLVNTDMYGHYNNESIFVKYTYVNLKIDHKKCSRCGLCVKSCPVSAIGQTDDSVVLDSAVCINCYYCMSICPEEAINIKPSTMNRLGWGIRKITGL